MSQEICNNGIDDDGDTLIDLNDDECVCTNVQPLTKIEGSICRKLDLTFDYPGVTSIQWYKDGIALAGHTYISLRAIRWDPFGEGTYIAYAETPAGCVVSEPYTAVEQEYFTDLGEIYLCEGDTLVLNGNAFTGSGGQRFKTQATQDGCDSIVQLRIKLIPKEWDRFYLTLCEGETFTTPNGNIISESGVYPDTLISSQGCDSISRYVVTYFEPKIENIFQSICEGETYVFHDIITTESGLYETVVTDAEGCETIYRVTLKVDSYSCDENYLSGSIFYDTNSNGIQDEDENGINVPINVNPSGNTLMPYGSGKFWMRAEDGENYTLGYDLAAVMDQNLQLTTAHSSYSIDGFIPGTPENHELNFGFVLSEPTYLGRLSNSPMNTRCNTTEDHSLSFQNQGLAITADEYVEIKYKLDTLFHIISSYPEPVLIEDDTYIYHFSDLEAYEKVTIELEIENPDEKSVNAIFENTTIASLIKGGESIHLDEKSYSAFILCSFDTNDKQVSPIGVGEDHKTLLGEELTYTVRFQNTGNAVAFDVSIIDSLDHNLDLSSFTVIGSSHEMTTKLNRHVVEFLFKNIYLPDSISNEPLSHGYVTYSITPKEEVLENTLITNNADIYFDSNPPIRTNTTENLLVENLNTTSILDLAYIDLKLRTRPNYKVELNWSLPTDPLISSYQIERRKQNGDWMSISRIPNTATTHPIATLSYIDNSPNKDINYYRIKVIKKNGAISYSQVASIRISYDNTISIYPNPISIDQSLTVINDSSETSRFTIKDKLGRQIQTAHLSPGKNSVMINQLTSGIYFCVCESESKKETYKLVIR